MRLREVLTLNIGILRGVEVDSGRRVYGIVWLVDPDCVDLTVSCDIESLLIFGNRDDLLEGRFVK